MIFIYFYTHEVLLLKSKQYRNGSETLLLSVTCIQTAMRCPFPNIFGKILKRWVIFCDGQPAGTVDTIIASGNATRTSS